MKGLLFLPHPQYQSHSKIWREEGAGDRSQLLRPKTLTVIPAHGCASNGAATSLAGEVVIALKTISPSLDEMHTGRIKAIFSPGVSAIRSLHTRLGIAKLEIDSETQVVKVKGK